MPKKRPSVLDRALMLTTIERFDRTHYLLTFPLSGNMDMMVTEKVTKEQLENIVRAGVEIGAKIARAFRSPVPRKRKARGDA